MSLANCGRSAPHAADLLTVDLGRAGGFERLDLCAQVLILRADAGIADGDHLAPYFANKIYKA
jgi:hypothetical protein